MNKLLILSVATLLSMPVFADCNTDMSPEQKSNLSAEQPTTISSTGQPSAINSEQPTERAEYESPFISEERTREGFLTHYLNNAIASGMTKADDNSKAKYGRKVTDYVSVPKFGGYFIGKFAYTSQDGKNPNNEFSQRLTRFYVDGTIFKHFAYRIQVQCSNASFHMKDYFVEWRRFPEFKVKIGQYKRAFGLENPYNPWDVGVGDYSQLTKKLTGHSDFIGAESSSNGGRDQGLQFQGDLFPIGKDKYRLIHYQVMVSNGQGINAGDANSQKDITGTIQIQPIKNLFIGFYGWTGNYTATNQVTVRRERYDIIAKYTKDDWEFRAEYAHSTGHKISDYKDAAGKQKGTTGFDEATATWHGTGRADAWYATLGIPCTKWLKTWLKYDVYRDDATWASTKSIYSVCPNFQIHKNLMFQLQFNYVNDRTLTKPNYCELWVESYVRF